MSVLSLHAAADPPDAADASRGWRPSASVEQVEIDLLLEAMVRLHGLDLGAVRRETMMASIRRVMRERRLRSVTALLEEVLHGGVASLAALLQELAPFSEPAFFGAFRAHVIPWLRTYPYSAIWAADGITGADVYALAILLEEAGLYDRVRIYATQSEHARMALLQAGVSSACAIETGEAGYRAAGGTRRLVDYYEAHGPALQVRDHLRRNVVWVEYDLHAGETFNEFDLILCRGLLPRMSAAQRRQFYRLVAESLSRFGLLALDESERPDLPPYANWFRAWPSAAGLHQRIR